MGTESELVLKSRKVYPEKLLMADFRFKYEDMDSCLEELLSAKEEQIGNTFAVQKEAN